MRIGELARATGVSRRLLRYYEEQGLLRPVRLPNGYRDYSESDVAAVRLTRALLARGLPTATIAEILPCVYEDGDRVIPMPCAGLVGHLRRERGRLDLEITQLKESRRALDSMLEDALNAH